MGLFFLIPGVASKHCLVTYLLIKHLGSWFADHDIKIDWVGGACEVDGLDKFEAEFVINLRVDGVTTLEVA